MISTCVDVSAREAVISLDNLSLEAGQYRKGLIDRRDQLFSGGSVDFALIMPLLHRYGHAHAEARSRGLAGQIMLHELAEREGNDRRRVLRLSGPSGDDLMEIASGRSQSNCEGSEPDRVIREDEIPG